MDATPELSADRRNELYRARIAVSIAFFIIGVGLGIWAVHIPLVSARLNLNSAVLGFVLLVMAIGAVAGMPLTGALLSRFGSRLPTAGLTFAFTLLFPLPILAGNFPFLLVSAFLFGAATGGADVAMNTQASEIEKARGRPTMSSFHGFYSVGGLAGSIAGAAIIASGWGNGQGAVTAGVVCLGLAALAAGNLWVSATPPRSGPRFVLPSWAVIGIGMLCFLCFALEGAIGDWSALYLTIDKLASPAAAASGYALYSLAMSVCRLTGDPVVARLGPRLTLSLGGVLVAVGIAVAVTVPSAFLAPVGFLIVGIGAANIVPVLFSAAAQTPGVPPSVGVAAVATLGYSGFLVAPPLLGIVGKAFGLAASLWIVAFAGLVIAVATLAMKRR